MKKSKKSIDSVSSDEHFRSVNSEIVKSCKEKDITRLKGRIVYYSSEPTRHVLLTQWECADCSEYIDWGFEEFCLDNGELNTAKGEPVCSSCFNKRKSKNKQNKTKEQV